MRRSLCALSIGLCVCAVACSAVAQLRPEDKAILALPLEAQAQHFLEVRDYVSLRLVLDNWSSPAEARRSLNWLKDRMVHGETIAIAYDYASNLWRLSRSESSPAAYAELKASAAMATTYAFAVIVVDGQKCKDPTAPDHNIEVNIGNWGKMTWSYLATLPPAERDAIVGSALAMEKETAPLRKNDGFVCGGGADEMKQASLAKGGKSTSQTVVLQNDQNYVPELKPEAEYRPRQEQAREQVPGLIAAILEKARTAN
jgi:ribosomal protein S30